MTVKELIELLQTKPQDLQVVYSLHSEYCLLEVDDIVVKPLCEPRPDGWVALARPDKPTQDYLAITG